MSSPKMPPREDLPAGGDATTISYSSRPGSDVTAPAKEAADRQPANRRSALLVVSNPSGNRSRVPIDSVPFLIGRQAGNSLVLRDNRVSRTHARILEENGEYVVEDAESRHGTFVNGQRVNRHALRNSDRIEFGFQDGYKLTFNYEDHELNRILDQIQPAQASGGRSNLGKLRALMEVARALQSSLSIERRADLGGGRGARGHGIRTWFSHTPPRRRAECQRGP